MTQRLFEERNLHRTGVEKPDDLSRKTREGE